MWYDDQIALFGPMTNLPVLCHKDSLRLACIWCWRHEATEFPSLSLPISLHKVQYKAWSFV